MPKADNHYSKYFIVLAFILLSIFYCNMNAKAKELKSLHDDDIKVGDTIDLHGMIAKVTKLNDGTQNGELSIIGIGSEKVRVLQVVSLSTEGYHVSVIEKNAFSGCDSIEALTIAYPIKIEEGAFKNCKNLEYIKFIANKSLTIEKKAFYNCKNLDIIIFNIYGSKCKIKIDKSAFRKCNNLTDLYVSRKNTKKVLKKFKNGGAKNIKNIHKYSQGMFINT